MRSNLESRSSLRPEAWCHHVKRSGTHSAPGGGQGRTWVPIHGGSIESSCTGGSGRENMGRPGLWKLPRKPLGEGGGFSLSPSPQQSNTSAVLSRHWQVDATPRRWLPGCPHTLHQGFQKPEDEPGSGGKKCLLQLLRRPRGPVRSGRRGLPGNHCLGPCFLQVFVTRTFCSKPLPLT